MTSSRLLDPSVIVAHGVDALTQRRPAALRHIVRGGRWSHPFAGWSAQVQRLEARNWEEMRASRLATSSGAALAELASSEFALTLPAEASLAVGEVTLRRLTTSRHGIIPRGSKIRVSANQDASLAPVASATWSTTEPKLVNSGQDEVTVDVVADRIGTESNAPLGIIANLGADDSSMPQVRVASNLFDRFEVAAFRVAGGGTAVYGDDSVRQAATENSIGQYGPVTGALVAGAMSAPGVRHVAVIDDPLTGVSQVYVADASWSWSAAFARRAGAVIADPTNSILGFGCAFATAEVRNRFVVVEADIALRTAEYLDLEATIRDNVRAAASDYFDTRLDWYAWNLRALRGALSVSDRRIASCTAVRVLDAVTRLPVPEVADFVGGPAEHLYLARSGVDITFAIS